MDIMLIFVVAGILLALLVGGSAGFLIGRASRKKDPGSDPEVRFSETEETPAPAQEEETAMTPSVLESSVAIASVTTASVTTPSAALTERKRDDYHPVVCLWRSRETGRIATEIKGKLYQDSAPLSSEVKKKLLEIEQEWAGWIGVAARMDAHARLDEFDAAAPAAAPAKPAPQEKPVEKPSAAWDADVYRLKDKKAERVPVMRPKSIAEQIDEILQANLAASHQENRAIRIIEDPERGVSVWVGLKRFNSIDEVEDPEALKLIREAVAEWERLSGEKR